LLSTSFVDEKKYFYVNPDMPRAFDNCMRKFHRDIWGLTVSGAGNAAAAHSDKCWVREYRPES
jgi:hypothetical protein